MSNYYIKVNSSSKEALVYRNNKIVRKLAKGKELEILKCLLDHEGQVLSRMQIIDQVWKETEEIPYDRVIDVYIKELRKKLHLDCISTIRNVGYKLER